MRDYKQILEAVNRGIQLALDDFEDEEQVQHVKSKQINHKDYTKEYLDLMKVTVDLGLPSGTRWCKYNVGCDWDKLSRDPKHTKPEDWYGKYYAWGETQEKDIYSESEYKFGNGFNGGKYSSETYYSQRNNKLSLEDDVAYQYNNKFKIPLMSQTTELLKYTDIERVDDYLNIQGLRGKIFTSKINGEKLFIPSAGYKINGGRRSTNDIGIYWLSEFFPGEIDEDGYFDLEGAALIFITKNNINMPLSEYFRRNHYHVVVHAMGANIVGWRREYGLPIRPVLKL